MARLKLAVVRFKRAIVATIAGAIYVLARNAGLEIASEDVQIVVDFLLVTGAVWLVPEPHKAQVKDVLEADDGEV